VVLRAAVREHLIQTVVGLQTRFGVSGGISELVLTEKKGVLTISVTFELRQIFELRDATLKPTFGSNSHRKNLVP
jgi:hypothetical protein